jgi:hypothetical protein
MPGASRTTKRTSPTSDVGTGYFEGGGGGGGGGFGMGFGSCTLTGEI